MKPLEPIQSLAERDTDGDERAEHFDPLCSAKDVCRATGYSYRTVMMLKQRGALKHLEHPGAVGSRIYSGRKLAALARGEDPTVRKFFGKAS